MFVRRHTTPIGNAKKHVMCVTLLPTIPTHNVTRREGVSPGVESVRETKRERRKNTFARGDSRNTEEQKERK